MVSIVRPGRLCLVLMAVLAFVAAVDGGQRFGVYKQPKPQGPKFVPGEVLVKFKAGAGEAAIKAVHGRHGTKTIYTSPFAGFKRVRIPKGKAVADAVNALRQEATVEYAEPNSICHAFMTPDDPAYLAQWHLWNPTYGGINVPSAWDASTGAGVVVAVVDSGVAYAAEDLAATNIQGGWDCVNDDADPSDDNAHGTHVTGTVAQSTNNGVGVAGVAFNCTIMPVKVLDANGSGTAADLAEGLYHAANNGAKVINMSLGWPVRGSRAFDPGATVHNAVIYAYNADVTIVCSSGNAGKGVVAYPAAYPECIAVGATRYDETRASYSCYGAALDIVAPGGDLGVDPNIDGYVHGVLQNTFNPNTRDTSDFGYWYFDGTSMAAPHVTGVAALVIAKYREINSGDPTPAEVRNILQSTAEDKGPTGWDEQYGYGIVNAAAALNELEPNDPPVVTITSPTHGTASDSGAPVAFAGTATDTEDGDISADLIWTSDRDGPIGNGGGFATSALADGVHVITATVTDSAGKTASASITIGVDVLALSAVDWGDAYRWRDIAENTYWDDPVVRDYTYAGTDGAAVFLDITSPAPTFTAYLVARGLKPNFAYQLKLNGKPAEDANANQILGDLGQWWGDEGYILFDCFVTDENGDAGMPLALDSSLHVLWKESQRDPVPEQDSQPTYHTLTTASFLMPWYDPGQYTTGTVGIYGQGEPGRPLPGQVILPGGGYNVKILLTEESFHSDGPPTDPDGGYWQTVMTNDNVQFIVEHPANQPPVAAFTYTTSGLTADFDASASSDPDGTIVSYEWDFGDEKTGSGVAASHAYAAAGTYPVTLTVTDDDGAIDETSQDVTVSVVVMPVMHAVSVTVTARKAGPNYFATATVHVVDRDSGEPVGGAAVEVTWSEAVVAVVTGITDASGIATVSAPKTRDLDPSSRYVATVTNVTKDGAVWDEDETWGEAPVP